MTPEVIDDNIRKLVRLTGSISEPIFLLVESEYSCSELNCFINVKDKIKKDGGSMVLGWQLWKSKNIVEAEFHAVWKSPIGKLKDITPKTENINKILFLPDSNLIYEDKQIDNIRLNITNNKLVDDFIEICKAIFSIENKGERAYKYNDLNYSETERIKRTVLRTWKNKLIYHMNNGGTIDSVCFFCDSGKSYKHCCGEGLIDRLRRI